MILADPSPLFKNPDLLINAARLTAASQNRGSSNFGKNDVTANNNFHAAQTLSPLLTAIGFPSASASMLSTSSVRTHHQLEGKSAQPFSFGSNHIWSFTDGTPCSTNHSTSQCNGSINHASRTVICTDSNAQSQTSPSLL